MKNTVFLYSVHNLYTSRSGVVGRLVDTAYLPKTVSGVASDEEGLDSPQTSGNVFLLVNFFSLLVMEVVVQKNIPQKQYGGRREHPQPGALRPLLGADGDGPSDDAAGRGHGYRRRSGLDESQV